MPITAPDFDPNARAKQAADVRYNSPEAQLKRALELAAAGGVANEAGINEYGTKGKEAIGQTFDQLDQNLAFNRTQSTKDLGTQADIIGRGYREANQIGEAARSAASQRLQQLAGTLGYGGANVAQAQSPLETLVAQLTSQNAQTDATRTGNLRNWAAQQDALLGEGQGAAQRDRANRLGSFESELLQALAQNKNQTTKQQYDLNASLLDLLNERGAFQVDEANKLADMLFGQQLQAGQFNLSEQVAQAEAADRAAARSQASAENNWRQQLAMMEFQKSIEDGDFARAQAIKDGMRQDAALALSNKRYDSEDAYKRERDATGDKWNAASFLYQDPNKIGQESAILQALGLMSGGTSSGLSGADKRAVARASGNIQQSASKLLSNIFRPGTSGSGWGGGVTPGGQKVGMFGIPTGISDPATLKNQKKGPISRWLGL